MSVYTKTGDKGKTSLIGGERVSKYDSRVEAYGTVDELTAQTAMLRDMVNRLGSEGGNFGSELATVLEELMTVAALLAVGRGGEGKVKDIAPGQIGWLEARMDEMEGRLKPITRFTIPGGHPAVSQAHICRTVCRRAERRSLAAAEQHDTVSKSALIYLNRLSDYFYLLGRCLTENLEVKENLWIP